MKNALDFAKQAETIFQGGCETFGIFSSQLGPLEAISNTPRGTVAL